MPRKYNFLMFFFLSVELISIVNAKQDKPRIQKGQLLQARQIIRSARTASLAAKPFSSVLFRDNFEAGDANWSLAGSWATGSPTSGPGSGYNSDNCVATNLSGSYDDNANDWLISNPISLPVLNGPDSYLKLSFWEWFEIESGYDYGKVAVKINGNTNWTLLDSRDGWSDWRQTIIDLTSYAGQTVQIALIFTSDGSQTYSGWYIDDVQIILEQPEPLSATMASLNHQNFPFIYMNVAVDTFNVGFPDLDQSNFAVYENDMLQTDYFEVQPPESGGGSRLADVVFVLDVTGSMRQEIDAVKQNMLNFVNALAESDINYAIGFVVFGDIVYTYNSGNLYYDESDILRIINNIQLGENRIGDGGDQAENQLGAMAEAAANINYRPGAQRIEIMLTDAESHTADYVTELTISSLIDKLIAANITVFPVFDNYESLQRQQYIPVAEATNPTGVYYHIYDNFNDIIEQIGTSIAATYLVRYKSSNPVADGTVRTVRVVVNNTSDEAECEETYVPGSMPKITRTGNTIALHDRAWADGTEFTIEVTIEDAAPPFVQEATLYYKNTSAAGYRSTSMTNVSGDLWQGIIYGSYVNSPGVDYYVTATDGENSVSDPSVDPVNNPYQIAILPNVAPQITHTPVTTLTPGTPISITAQITDNTNSLEGAKLYYRKLGQLIYEHVEMAKSPADRYSAFIPDTFVTNDGVEYYIKAWDDFGMNGYFATPDNPIQILNPLSYVYKKESIIEFFLNESFYVDAENKAQEFTDDIEAKINNDAASPEDVEALQRLFLVEQSAHAAYPGAVQVAELTAHCTQQLAIAIFVEVIVGKLDDLLKPLKKIPVLKHLYYGVHNLITKFNGFVNQIRLRVVPEIANRFVPLLVEYGYSTSNARSTAFTLAHEIFKVINKQLYEDASNAVEGLLDVNIIQQKLTELNLNVYEKGIKIDFSKISETSGVFWIGGTENSIMFSTTAAEKKHFANNDVHVITQIIQNEKQGEIVQSNTKTVYDINQKINLAEILNYLALFGVLIVGIAAVIAGIIACPAGGIGCIISAISGMGVAGALHGLLGFFTGAQILLHTWGLGLGVYQLDFNLPAQLTEVKELAFQDSGNNLGKSRQLAGSESYSTNAERMSFSPVPTQWADSLIIASYDISSIMAEIRRSLIQENWDAAAAKYDSLLNLSESYNSKQEIVDCLLNNSYFYNTEPENAELDSLYLFTGANGSAANVALGFSHFAIGFAIATKPSGATIDTLTQIMDETINRVEHAGYVYRNTFNYYKNRNYLVPPVVPIIQYDAEKGGSGYLVRCRIKNASEVDATDVAVSLKSTNEGNLRINAKTDTLWSKLEAYAEESVEWQVDYSGNDNVLFLEIISHPNSLPGDFVGESKILSQFHIKDSTPPTGGQLDNNNIYIYPNPFNPDMESGTIRYSLAHDAAVTIKVYDAAMQLVATLLTDEPQQADVEQAVSWNGTNDLGETVANGVYFYVIESSAGERAVGKAAVLR